jgi:hypothetical protein
MTFGDIQVAAFRDEMEKIAGEMQGATRIGRKPIGVEKLLERQGEIEGLPDFMLEAGETAAKAIAKMAGLHVSHKTLAALGAGGAAALAARQMNEDRRLGRMVRRQQAVSQ